jgi:hypothetical protein
MHKWHNASETEPARFIAIALPAKAFEISAGAEGKMKMVEEEHVARSESKEWDVSML